eukprot:1171744-Karenia_brevis.AAC.1
MATVTEPALREYIRMQVGLNLKSKATPMDIGASQSGDGEKSSEAPMCVECNTELGKTYDNSP